MKINERVQIAPILGPTGADGLPVAITGVVTAVSKVHAIVKLTIIPQGVRIYVAKDGNHHLVTDSSKKTPPAGSHLLQVGEESAFTFEDLCSLDGKKKDEGLTFDEAKARLGKDMFYLEHCVKTGSIQPLKGNRFLLRDIETIATCSANLEAEYRRSGQHQDRVRLANQYVEAVNK